MTTDPAVSLAKWFSHARPIRALAFAHRLQWAVQSGQLTTDEDVQMWVETLLKDGAGFHDALCLASAYEARSEDEVATLNTLCEDYCKAAGRQHEIAEQGEVFTRIVQRAYGLDVSELAYPVAVGRAASKTGKPLEMTLRLFLQAFAARLVAAALKHLGRAQAQPGAIERDVMPTIDEVVRATMNLATKDSAAEHVFAQAFGPAQSKPTQLHTNRATRR